MDFFWFHDKVENSWFFLWVFKHWFGFIVYFLSYFNRASCEQIIVRLRSVWVSFIVNFFLNKLFQHCKVSSFSPAFRPGNNEYWFGIIALNDLSNERTFVNIKILIFCNKCFKVIHFRDHLQRIMGLIWRSWWFIGVSSEVISFSSKLSWHNDSLTLHLDG